MLKKLEKNILDFHVKLRFIESGLMQIMRIKPFLFFI